MKHEAVKKMMGLLLNGEKAGLIGCDRDISKPTLADR